MVLRQPIENVSLFCGKNWDFRAKIIEYLTITEKATTWQVAAYLSKDVIMKNPSQRSSLTKKRLSGVYRSMSERMIPKGYVEECGKQNLKGNDVPLYRLTFKGSLIALLLDLGHVDLKKLISNTADVNTFYRLMLMLEKNGMKWEMTNHIILDGIIAGLKKNMINLESNDESIIGQSVISALMSHLALLKRQELKTIEKNLSNLLERRFPGKIQAIFGYLFNMYITPMFWEAWCTDENAQLITLNNLVYVTLNPDWYKETKMEESKPDKMLSTLDEIPTPSS